MWSRWGRLLLARQAVLVITDNLIGRTIVEHRQAIHAPENFIEGSLQLAARVSATRPLRPGAIVLLHTDDVRDDAATLTQFNRLSCAKPRPESPRIPQLAQRYGRHFHRWPSRKREAA